MSDRIEAAVERYMAMPYRMEVSFEGDHWAAEFPELPGLVAGHETWEGLRGAVEDAKRAYFDVALQEGMVVPTPSTVDESYSGRFMLRLGRSLHGSASRRARAEGISLNAFITVAVAKEIGRAEAIGQPSDNERAASHPARRRAAQAGGLNGKNGSHTG